MDAVNLLAQLSSQAAADNPIPKVRLGYIDHSFDVTKYPQIKPRVVMDGQGMSDKGYTCISSYDPIPGDRVVLVPVGTSYVIIGAVDNPGIVSEVQKASRSLIYPGTLLFSANSHGVGQYHNSTEAGMNDSVGTTANNANGCVKNWGNSLIYDPYDFTEGASSFSVIQPNIDGLMEVRGSVMFPDSPSARRYLKIQSSWGIANEWWDERGSREQTVTSTGVAARLHFSCLGLMFNGGRRIRIPIWSSSGTQDGFNGGTQASIIEIKYVGQEPIFFGDDDTGA